MIPIKKQREYAQEASVRLSQMGMSPAAGKLLGWLLICDPASQSSVQLSEALGLSKGSVSTGMRQLERSGLVRRVALEGRGHAYEMLPDAFLRAAASVDNYLAMQGLMQRGLALLGDEDAPQAQRLRVTRDLYAFIAAKLPELINQFRRDAQKEAERKP